ncbi:MAG: HD domain-containing protein [Actinomycetota bacterium]|nr:HD domain-containing protein [Actinomycetota bacterium]
MSLKAKIISIIGLVILISVGLSTAAVLRIQSKKMVKNDVETMSSMSNMIIRSVEMDMSEGRSDEVHKILENIGRSPEILSLRIVSPDGYILNSKEQSEIGYRSPESLYLKDGGRFAPVLQHNVLLHFAPVYNKPRCYGCHSPNIKTNGIVEIRYDFSRSGAVIRSMRHILIFSNVITILLVSVMLSLLFSKKILKPLNAILATARSVEAGNLEARADVRTGDEFAILADSFNRSIQEVKRLYEKDIRKEREISRARSELEHKRTLEELNGQLEFKIKEVETANKAILSLTRELKTKNIELEKMVDRLKRISEVGRVLSSIMETEELIKLVIRSTAELLKVERGSIYLKKSGGRNLALQYNKGMGVEGHSDYMIEAHPLYKKLLAGGSNVFARNALDEGGLFAIGVPLKMKGQVVGGILLEKDGSHFTEDELEILSTLANQAMISIENAWLYDSVKSNYFGTIQALVNALEANDKYTRGHSERVKTLSVQLGRHIGLNNKEIENLEHAAILHDIGKIGVDSNILNKAGRLTNAEFSMVKAHPLIGDEILGPLGTLEGVRTTILQHHERYDGTGYPYGVAGEEISLKARILSVVDTFDAMMTDRSYRKARTISEAKGELYRGSGTQFDPLVVSAFLDMLDLKAEELLGKAGYAALC